MITLVVDTETTGLPLKGVPAGDQRQARVMQVGAVLLQDEKEVACLYTRLYPDQWPEVHPMATAAHGLTVKDCEAVGVGQQFVVNMLADLVDAADIVVAHNYKFDYQMLNIEFELQGKIFAPKKHACTMELMTNVCGLTKANGQPKWPTMQEALSHCYLGEVISKAHDALGDVRAAAKVWLWLQQNKKRMHDWQLRVIEEKKALDEKISKLDAFIRNPANCTVSWDDMNLLRQQGQSMAAYSLILAQRIRKFST